jgi:hypothetical protein
MGSHETILLIWYDRVQKRIDPVLNGFRESKGEIRVRVIRQGRGGVQLRGGKELGDGKPRDIVERESIRVEHQSRDQHPGSSRRCGRGREEFKGSVLTNVYKSIGEGGSVEEAIIEMGRGPENSGVGQERR